VNDLATLQALGLELPSPAFLLGAILFGLVGMWAWASGRRRSEPRRKWLGVALCFFPYLVTQTAWMWATGLALCAALIWARD
jgi:hypothetical protein